MADSEEKIARDWIAQVETEASREIRERDLYPLLRAWAAGCGTDILDIGCGQGICATLFPPRHRYTGVDPSVLSIARAGEIYAAPHRTFALGDAYRLPFADASFDAAFAVSVWHLLADLPRASAELSRVLRPRGKFLLVMANPETYDLWNAAFPGELQQPSRAQIEGALQAAGLAVETRETFRPAQGAPARHHYLVLRGAKQNAVTSAK